MSAVRCTSGLNDFWRACRVPIGVLEASRYTSEIHDTDDSIMEMQGPEVNLVETTN